VTKTIIVASSFPDFLEFLEKCSVAALPEARVHAVASYEEMTQILTTTPPGAVVICDLVWEEYNFANNIIALATAYPQFAWGVVSPIDLFGLVSQFYPIPLLSQPTEAGPVINLIRFLAEDLRGRTIASFTIREFAGQNRFGRAYQSYQTNLRRDVLFTIGPPDPEPEETEYFQASASAMARVNHPAVYAIYEIGQIDGRSFFAQEPVTSPTLFSLQTQGIKFDSRMIARVIETVAVILKFLRDHQLNHHLIKNHHVTVDPNGVIKVFNAGCAEPTEESSEVAQLQELALMLQDFINPTLPVHPPLADLCNAMQQGSTNLDEVIRISTEIDLQLAPVKVVPKRKETVLAEEALAKARKRFLITTIVGSALAAIVLIFFLIKLIDSFTVLPATDFRRQIKIPAGRVTVGNIPPIDLKEFYMDEFEVSIGQYKRFLETIAGQDPDQYLPAELRGTRKNFEPEDWAGILRAITSKKPYSGFTIIYDSPIFNVDYPSAVAYATWARKRLPTEAEWIRAASGNENFRFPWGNEPTSENANTGIDLNTSPTGVLAGSIDGHRGPAPVNGTPRDVSPFGVRNMAGNVSEWVTATPEFGRLPADRQIFKGGNYFEPRLFPNQARLPAPQDTRSPTIGIRLVSDQPVD
jgi:formylglycine-generating enzyme required for sulfatase activity